MAANSSTADDGKIKSAAPGRPCIHDSPVLSQGILATIRAKVPLEIKASTIPGAGSGLFSTGDITEGVEIFRSQPIVNCRDPSLDHVCDYCFANSKTTLHPDGHFLNSEDKTPKVLPCSGCKVARYCTKVCQKRAWKGYHKYECNTIGKEPGISAAELALQRILILDKEGMLSSGYWTALRALESSFLNHDESEAGEVIMHTAIRTGQRISGLLRDLNVVWSLYCAILINSMNIRPAESETSHGCSLDFAVAMMNHDCRPNAFVFFEGSQVRVRSLRNISAGDEIFTSYVDPRADVLRRQEVLKKTFFINCRCKKCTRELKDHHKLVDLDESRLDTLARAQESLVDITESATRGFYIYFKHDNAKLLEKYIEEVNEVVKRTFAKGEWPDSLAPLPSVRMTLSTMHKDSSRLVAALSYGLKGCLLVKGRGGPTWVMDLLDVTRTMVQVGLQPEDGAAFEHEGFPDRTKIRIVTSGYAQELALATRKTFGQDTVFTKATLRWAAHFRDVPGQPNSTTLEFGKRYEEAQLSLLKWAGVAETWRIFLPGSTMMDDLANNVEKLAAGE